MENEQEKSPEAQVDQNPEDNSTENQQKERSVAYDTHRKLLNEKKALQSKLREYEAQQKEQEANTLKEQNKWKELAEMYKSEAEEVKANYEGLNNNLLDAKKLNAFDKVMGSRLKSDKYYNFVDTDKIVIDDNGDIVEDSVRMAVESFRNEFGDDLLEKKQVGKLPSGNPSASMMPQGKSLDRMTGAEKKAELRGLMKDIILTNHK